MFIDCETCHGKGRIKEYDFDGATMRQCRECGGKGEIELTAEETAIMEECLANIAAGLDAGETVAEIEEALRVAVATPMPMPIHPNMTATFFDAAVKRAFDAGLSISRTGTPGTVAVSSGTDDDTYYTVTIDSCSCIAGQKLGRCYHRSFYCWLLWVQTCDAIAAAAHTPEPIAA